MIIFLYGADNYRRQQKQKEIINQYQTKHSSLTIDKFDLEEESELQKLKDFLEARSLFDSFKLAIIFNLLKSDFNRLEEWWKSWLESKEVVLLASDENEPKKEWEFLLEKPVLGQQFDNLTIEQFKKFAARETKKRNLNLKPETLNLLAGQYEGDSWGLVTELDKLALAKNFQLPTPKSPARTSGSFCGTSNFQLRYNFFNFINKLQKGTLSEKLKSLEILLSKEDPAKIFNLLAYSINKKRFADYDLAVKSGKLDYETVLTDFAVS